MLGEFMYFFSPLEQFEIFPILQGLGQGYRSENLGVEGQWFLSLTNADWTSVSGLVELGGFCCLVGNGRVWFGSERWQFVMGIVQSVIGAVIGLIQTVCGLEGLLHLGVVMSIGMFVLIFNVLGLMPFGFCVTSQIFVTQVLGFFVIGGLTIYGIRNLGGKWFRVFMPRNVTGVLLLFLIGIDIISYIFRSISLSVRLFANTVAGHALLHIFVNLFVNFFGVISKSLTYLPTFVIPFGLISAIFVLETGVAFLQCYVFVILYLIYVKDSLYVH